MLFPQTPPALAADLYFCAILERDRAAVETALANIPAGGLYVADNFVRPREWFVGYVARLFGDTETARTALTAARSKLEKTVQEQPDYAAAWSLLGRIDAALERKEEAIREGRRACELLPLSKDAWFGPGHLRTLAEIICLDGRKRRGNYAARAAGGKQGVFTRLRRLEARSRLGFAARGSAV